MNTVSINELWSIFLLHSFLHGISKAFKEKLSRLYPGKYLFLITNLGNCYIRRIYAKTISESMLGKIPRFCPVSVCKCLGFFSCNYMGLAEWLPFLVHCIKWLFSLLLSSLTPLNSLQAAVWGLRVSVSIKMLWCGLLSGALQRSAIPLARDQGRALLKIHTCLLVSFVCRC